jgi:leader peptidase (prepilin peptidase)/N-methyltransferase
MLRILGTIFAGLFGLAFGSFLNVCLSRWPEGESIVQPASHCRNCTHTLSWWENIPLFSWLALRGRCRDCRTWIGWRYPLVEAAVGLLWVTVAWRSYIAFFPIVYAAGLMIFVWLMVALAILDAEHLWLPDSLTIPGILLGLLWWILGGLLVAHALKMPWETKDLKEIGLRILGILLAAGLILLIRWTYQRIRKHEGLGLGDAKLMALLAAWLGLPLTLLAFVIGVLLGSLAALVLLARPALQRDGETWALSKLPLGTFLCIGGIVSSLCGQPILNAYLRWAGF